MKTMTRVMSSWSRRVTAALSRIFPPDLVCFLPSRLAIYLIPRQALTRFMLQLVQRQEFEPVIQLATLRLKKKAARLQWKRYFRGEMSRRCHRKRSIVLVGPQRTGKTTIAGILEDKHGYMHVGFDAYNELCRAIPDELIRNQFKHQILTAIMESGLPGLVIEGVRLMTFEPGTLRSLSPGLPIAQKYGAHYVLVASANSSPETKMAAIIDHRQTSHCHTVQKSDDQLAEYAEHLVALGKQLRDHAAEQQIDYYEIAVGTFAADIDMAVKRILQAMNAEPTQPQSALRRQAA